MATNAAQILPSLDPLADRIMSVDVLRGFDMFWIVGGGQIVQALGKCGDHPVTAFLVKQLTHCKWEGLVFYDLIFPLFLFLVGMAIVFSVGRIVEKEGRAGAYRRIFRRFFIMFVLGMVYSGGLASGIDGVRIMGVLQRLALCYLIVSIMYIHLKPRQMAAVGVVLLAGYWAWLSFVPVPGLGRTSFAVEENWANYIDRLFLPLRKNDGAWDPEGILSTLPAVGTCLLGFFAGLFIKSPAVPARKKGLYLMGAGLVLLAAGCAWGLQFPIIKRIWTSSYVLAAGGYSCLLLGVFYQVIDVWKFRAWTAPFLWIGSNALAVYMARNLVDFSRITDRFVGAGHWAPEGGLAALASAAVTLGWVVLLAGFLYRRKVFIRI
jgi:predicted acyltransferase